jgi:hypothetical protein
MLPQSYCQLYQHFQHMLHQMQKQLEQGDRSQLQAMLAETQTYFQQQILSLEPEAFEPAALEPADAVRLHSFQVEINKQLRLLNTDLMFLQTARLSVTQSQKRQQIGDRLTLLLRYCEGIVG